MKERPAHPGWNNAGFIASEVSVRTFQRARDGGWLWRVLARLVGRPLTDTPEAHQLLQEAVEGALLACFQHVRRPTVQPIALDVDQERGSLQAAISRRLSGTADSARQALAGQLFAELFELLGQRELAFERVRVHRCDRTLFASRTPTTAYPAGAAR